MAWMPGWSKRWVTPIQKGKVGNGGVTNFATYLPGVVIPAEVIAAAYYEDLRDLRVTLDDGTTLLNLESVSGSRTAGTGEAHFNHPSLSSAVDTTVIAYLGNPDVGKMTTAQQQAVWTAAGYVGVWHFADGSTLSMADATGNGNSGTNSNVSASPSGMVNGCGSFTGGSPISYINAGIGASLRITGALSLSCWGYNDDTSVPTAQGIISRFLGANQLSYTLYLNFEVSPPKLMCAVSANGSAYVIAAGTTGISTSAWRHMAATYIPSTSCKVYLNGQLDGQNTTSIPASLYNSTADAWIGCHWSAQVERTWDGLLDEVRIANVAKSLAWYATEYNNQSSPATFYGAGTVESAPTGGTVIFFRRNPIGPF